MSAAALRRRLPYLIYVVLIAAQAAYLVAQTRPSNWTAQALVVVPSGQRANDPGRAFEAGSLAASYAILIPDDPRILRHVASSVRQPPKDVEDRIEVFNQPDTALLRLVFRGADSAQALTGARALASAVAGEREVSPLVPRGSLDVVRLPDAAEPPPSSTAMAVAVGSVLGLILAGILLIAWERADPRIDTIADLQAELQCPATSFGERVPVNTVRALVARWDELAGRPGARVTLLAASDDVDAAISTIAERLRDAAASGGAGSVEGPAGGRNAAVSLLVAGRPGTEAVGEAVAATSDLTVLVLREGTRVAAIRSAVDALRQFGTTPDWALLVPRRAFGGGRGLGRRTAGLVRGRRPQPLALPPRHATQPDERLGN